ncbi:MAG: GldG family protein [Acidobacteria bacterium]|nr:GldG family protein [Acidobacteriota bacterium]
MALKDRIQGPAGQKVFAGTNILVYTLVGLAIVVLVNWFTDRNNHRWDLTPEKKYTLSDQTAKILKGLSREVTIYCFDREGGTRSRRDLLGNYEVLSKNVKVRFVDPDRNPALAKQYGVRTYGTIVVATSEKHYEAQGESEEGVTNAIVRLLKGQKEVYFIQGHGERDIDNTDRAGLSNLKKALENENYVIKTQVLLQNLTIPADAALLVVAGPRNDYLPQETEAIQKYLAGGGRALFMLDPAVELPNLTQMLAAWNIKMRNDLVIDENPIAQIFGTRPEMPLVLKYGSSPIVQPLARTATLFPLTRSFEVAKDFKQGVTADALCETTADSYGVADFNPRMTRVTFRQGKDVRGPLSVAVSGSVSSGSGEQSKEGRFVAMGTSSAVANNYLGFQGNRDLIMNMVNWLAADEDLISIRPKAPDSQTLTLNQKQMRTILLGGIVGLPLLIILAGTTVWFRRRR